MSCHTFSGVRLIVLAACANLGSQIPSQSPTCKPYSLEICLKCTCFLGGSDLMNFHPQQT